LVDGRGRRVEMGVEVDNSRRWSKNPPIAEEQQDDLINNDASIDVKKTEETEKTED
jgi:hypothetical protein